MNSAYQVIWKKMVIEEQIASFVVLAMERGDGVDAITQAMNRIDFLLQNSPQDRGESRDSGKRILIVPPLSVIYRIHEADHKVFVLQARYSPRARE